MKNVKRSVVALALILLGYAYTAGAASAREDYFCRRDLGTSCITNYCNPWQTPGWDCRYQEGTGECTCIPIA